MNLGTFPERRAALSPREPAAVDGDRRVTFAELRARCDRAARMLLALGVEPGDRIGVLLPNSLEWLECFFAAARIGAIVVPLNWRLSPDELAAICADAGVERLIYARELAPAEGLLARYPLGARIAVGDSHGVGGLHGVGDPHGVSGPRNVSGQPDGAASAYEALVAAQRSDPVDPRGGDDDPLLIIYTSGTTGRPKGAVHTHRTWYWAVATVAASADIRPGDRALVVAPMYHVGGLVMSTLHVQAGVATVCMRAFDAAGMLRLIRDERVAHFLCVPTMLNATLSHEAFAAADFSSVRWCYSVGAPTPPALIEAFHHRGLLVQLAYGLTETGGPATVVPPQAVLAKPNSVGVPFFHTDVRIADADGAPAPPGAAGEVHIRAPHVITHYWRNPEATAAAIHDGWLHTGDIGRLDEHGYLYLVDRKHDMIISGGENIYPSEVERVLVEHGDVADAVVFGAPDTTWGETVCAAVQVRAGRALTADALLAHCRGRLAGYKVPRRVIFVDELPRTATGKSLRRDLRRRLEALDA